MGYLFKEEGETTKWTDSKNKVWAIDLLLREVYLLRLKEVPGDNLLKVARTAWRGRGATRYIWK